MKTVKRILSILFACVMLMMAMPLTASAEGTQANPIDANAKWFGYGVNCFLLNTTLEAGDEDGVWYELIADADGILQFTHSSSAVEYFTTVWVNGVEYPGFADGVYCRPITTLPVTVGDVITIQIIAQDTSLGGLVYANAKFVTGENTLSQTVKVKSTGLTVYVAAGATVYYQDDTTNAVYATKGLIVSGDSVADVTVLSVLTADNEAAYTDTDGDNTIELVLAGSAGAVGAPAVKPAWAIVNGSSEDICLTLTVVDAAHECVYDDAADVDCNTCGEVRQVPDEPVEILHGDANGDGAINIRDVVLLQQFIAGWDVTLNEAAADANGDGAVNIRDVVLLQQYIAGWDVSLVFNDGLLSWD